MHSPLLLQLVVILVAARLCGLLLRRFGQPPVIGEMAAGIVLGPIVFGAAFPECARVAVPEASLGALTSLSTLGLVLFMFVVGAELRTPDGVRAQLRAAGWSAPLSVLCRSARAWRLAGLYPALAPAGVGFWPFALFLAAAMSITAFPVMARILKDRGMTRTHFGQLALGSAAMVDVVDLDPAGVGRGAGRHRRRHCGLPEAAFLKACWAAAGAAGVRAVQAALCLAAAHAMRTTASLTAMVLARCWSACSPAPR